jgi:hypothetical protein
MKNFSVISVFLLSIIFFFTSCDKDENGLSETQITANQQNALEDRKILASELENNVGIDGATTIKGTAPAPNGSLDFNIATNQQKSQQKIGFNIEFSSTDNNVAGAYIQLFDGEGNKVDGYFDVPASAFNQRLKGKKDKGAFGQRTQNHEGDYIDVDFGGGLAPGQFCYEICLYDADNNVSSIVEVCVEVEAWGGNADLVGTWVFNEEASSLYEDDFGTIYCNSGEMLDYNYNNEKNEILNLKFTSNGNYEDEYKDSGLYLDYGASQENCEIIYQDEEYVYHTATFGNWTFDESTNELMVIAFEHKDLDGSSDGELLPEGDLYFDNGKININGNRMTLTFSYVDDFETIDIVYAFDRQ